MKITRRFRTLTGDSHKREPKFSQYCMLKIIVRVPWELKRGLDTSPLHLLDLKVSRLGCFSYYSPLLTNRISGLQHKRK